MSIPAHKSLLIRTVLTKSQSESDLLPPRHFIVRSKLRQGEPEIAINHSHFETPEEYFSQTRMWAQTLPKKWVEKIFNKESEQDRVWEDNPNYVLVPDKGWTGYQAEDLHLLAIFKRQDLLSIRDLKDSDCQLLQTCHDQACKMIKDKHQLEMNQLKIYFHYYPSTWQLHIHFVNMVHRSNSSIEQAHNFSYVIQNLSLGVSYYQKVTLQTKINPSATPTVMSV